MLVQLLEHAVGFAGGGGASCHPATQLDEPEPTLRHHSGTGAPWLVMPQADWAFATCKATSPRHARPSLHLLKESG